MALTQNNSRTALPDVDARNVIVAVQMDPNYWFEPNITSKNIQIIGIPNKHENCFKRCTSRGKFPFPYARKGLTNYLLTAQSYKEKDFNILPGQGWQHISQRDRGHTGANSLVGQGSMLGA